MEKNNKRKKCDSSSSDDNDISLSMIKMNGHVEDNEDLNSFKSLCKNSTVPCEFCDKVSKNRYSSIIHNARHIIIPLLNLNVYECGECLHHFTTQYELNRHIAVKHIITQFEPKIMLVKFQPLADAIEISSDSNDRTTVCNTKNNSDFNDNTSACNINDNPNINDSINLCNIMNNADFNSVTSIKNRLVFEDEDDDIIKMPCGDVLTDLTTDCKVNMEISPWLEKDGAFEGESVHFTDLLQRREYYCKRCHKLFPNRYESILHETRHISLEKTQIQYCKLCEKYIPGYLRHHIVQRHPFNVENRLTQCTKCGMKYTNYETHRRIECLEINVTYKERSVIIQLCDMCFSFCRNTQTVFYSIVGVKNKLGKRTSCEQCGAQCFDINLVERTRRFKGKAVRPVASSGKKKVLTYEERLKVIRHRLKMMRN